MNTLLFLGPIGTGEIIVLALAVLVLFGAKKIPELMKGVGKGIRGFKDGLKGIEDEINNPGEEEKKS
ncbi:MAG TPA: twin-arginine translocase TatA/TatE family subunit [Dysgonomonas sp.]|nr:twin-arginine translocase TatA/TatE family subunit [Dysgonomonas sp.]